LDYVSKCKYVDTYKSFDLDKEGEVYNYKLVKIKELYNNYKNKELYFLRLKLK